MPRSWKFIEKNWGLKPLSRAARQSANPVMDGADAYVPQNRPAIGDLTTCSSSEAEYDGRA